MKVVVYDKTTKKTERIIRKTTQTPEKEREMHKLIETELRNGKNISSYIFGVSGTPTSPRQRQDVRHHNFVKNRMYHSIPARR